MDLAQHSTDEKTTELLFDVMYALDTLDHDGTPGLCAQFVHKLIAATSASPLPTIRKLYYDP